MLFSFRQHHDIFSLAVAKAYDIAVPQLNVSTTSNLLTVQPRSVCAVQVDEIWFDLAYLVAVLVRLCDVSELHNSVLLANARVFQLEVDDGLIASHEPAAARVEVNGINHVFALEDEHAPLLFAWWFARLRRLVVFEDGICAGHSIRFFGE